MSELKKIRLSQLPKYDPREGSAAALTDTTRAKVRHLLEEYQAQRISRDDWHKKTLTAVQSCARYHLEEANLKEARRASTPTTPADTARRTAEYEARSTQADADAIRRLQRFERKIQSKPDNMTDEEIKEALGRLLPAG